jgi:hypothetical protein
MKGRDLNKHKTRGKSRDEGHHGGRYRDSERQHPISSAGRERNRTTTAKRVFAAAPVGLLEGTKAAPAPLTRHSTLLTLAKLRL